jgi:hypothetical protein
MTATTLPKPTLYWNFNETGGVTATDSASGALMTIDRADSFVNGKLGNGLRFNPLNGAKKVSTHQPEMPPPWTVGLWVLREAATQGSSLLSGGKAALKLEQWNSGGVLGYTEYSYGQAGFGGDETFNASAPLGQWVHLTYTGTSSGVSLYVNGEFNSMKARPITLGLDWIGSSHGDVEFASMILDELKIFNQALDADQVRDLYANAEAQIHVTEGGLAVANGASVSMGSATAGSSGLTKTFTISNTGNAALNIASVSLNNQSDYTISPSPLTRVLQKGDAVSFNVTFSPRSPTLSNAAITIASNDPKQAAYNINLSGNGIAAAKPQIEVAENYRVLATGSNVDFGSTVAAGSRVTKNFSITNRGNGPLQINQIQLGGAVSPFSINLPPLPQTLAPGQAATFAVTFAPSGTQSALSTVSISSNDDNHSPFVLRLAGRSVGTASMLIKQHPTEANISNGQTVQFLGPVNVPAVHILIQNQGDANLVLENFTVSNPAAFLDAGGRNLAGSGQGLISYGGKSARDSQTTFEVIPAPGVFNAASLNGTRITFTTNDPRYPVFAFTVTGF